VLDIELCEPLVSLHGLAGYDAAHLLVRSHGVPVGYVHVDLDNGVCGSDAIRTAIIMKLGTDPSSLVRNEPFRFDGPWPSLTVAVCTRSRPDDLAECLRYLDQLDYPDLELLVIDNAPDDDANALVCSEWARVRRVVEPRPGLSWARNRAVLEARGEILAFTDDDVRVDRDWAREIIMPFVQDDGVGAVAGLGVPLELETPAQLLFEEYGGASGGFTRIHMQGGPEWGVRGMWHYGLMAPHGSGANMAFRRSVFDTVALFDTALGAGTVTNGGEDTEMLFRVLAHGFGMVYEPRAIIRHRHRLEYEGVERQISGWGSGMYSFLTRSVLAFPRAWWVIGLLGARNFGHLVRRVVQPGSAPRRLVLTELAGAVTGPARYVRARSAAREIERCFGPQSHQHSP